MSLTQICYVSFAASQKQNRIQRVFQEYAEQTCIRFRPRNNENNFLRIEGSGGCSSYVGRQFFRENGQPVSIFFKIFLKSIHILSWLW